MIRYARVLIDMQLGGLFPDFVEFFNEHDILIRQQLQYEWLPIKCLGCGMYGHKEEVCKNKEGPRKEWRVKHKENIIEARHTPDVTPNENSQNGNYFTKVTRGVPTEIRTHIISTPSTSNSYQILAEDGGEQGNIVQSLHVPPFHQ